MKLSKNKIDNVSVQNLDKFPSQNFLTKLGKLHVRDFSSISLTCLLAYLRMSGKTLKLDDLLDIAPIPLTGMTEKLRKHIFKRAGVQINLIDQNHLQFNHELPLLIVRNSGYAFLVVGINNGNYHSILPGTNEQFFTITKNSDVLKEIAEIYVLKYLEYGPARFTFLKKPKLWLIPWYPEYTSLYDSELVRISDAELISSSHFKIRSPDPLPEYSEKAILASHLSMCPELSNYFGELRKINLKRGTPFVDVKSVKKALGDLLLAIETSNPTDFSSMMKFTAKAFTDFLTIHPFHNGNRRMAMLITNKYMEKWQCMINWNDISISEIYFWTRCASRGHFKPMISGFLRSMTYF